MPSRRLRGIARDARHFFWDRPRLEMSLADQVRFAPLLAQLVVTRRCNLRCAYCSEYDRTSAPVPLPELRARLEAVRRLGALAVQFTGGEPLLHPQLTELVAAATRSGFPARMLISNVTLLVPERIDALNDAGLTHLQVSVDGVAPTRSTVKVLDHLRPHLDVLARRARFAVTMSAVVGACPPAEVLAVVDYAKSRRFIPRVLLLHDAAGQLRLDPAAARTYAVVVERLGRSYREAHRYREALLAGRPAPFRCRAGARYLYVDEAGLVRYCSQYAGPALGSIHDFRPADLRRHFFHGKGCDAFCTVGCARSASKLDEWRPAHGGREPPSRGGRA